MFEVKGSNDSLLPRICDVDAVGMGAQSREFLAPKRMTFWRRPSQS